MDATIHPTPTLQGILTLPADKAICHRAALLCALAEGSSELAAWSDAEDCQRTLEVVQRLGARVAPSPPNGIRLEGVGRRGLRQPAEDLFCGDSGTTMRLAAGLVAGQPFQSRLTAGASLSLRPMRRIIEPLVQMGASIEARRPPGSEECYPPLTVEGRRPLQGVVYTAPIASAQVKSAILLAGLFADHPTTVIEPIPTRDHTERLLQRMGGAIQRVGESIAVEPLTGPLTPPERLEIPGDASSAAFFVVAASLVARGSLTIRRVGLNPTRTRSLEVLRRMGAAIEVEAVEDGWEPSGNVHVTSQPLHGTTIEAPEVPRLIDELPILMVAACAASSPSRFAGLTELRVKETNRLRSMVTGLRQLGAVIRTAGDDGLIIEPSRLRGAAVESFRDHRTAMSLAVAGLIAEGSTRIRHAECVEKSFPEFFTVLSRLTTS